MLYFRPAFWMSILLVPSLLLLIWLGLWQVQRLQWKTDLIATLATAQAAPAIKLPKTIPDINWTKVQISGAFVQPPQQRRLFTTHNGAAGYRYLGLFVTNDQRLLVVDRGFAPTAITPPPPDGEQRTLTGFLHPAGQKGSMTPAPEPDKNIWYWRDLETMFADVLPTQNFITSYVLDMAPPAQGAPDSWPRALGAPPDPVNNHLDYALTWFGLAFALIGVYLVWHHKNDRLRWRKKPS